MEPARRKESWVLPYAEATRPAEQRVASPQNDHDLPNPHLKRFLLDNLYHFGLDSSQPLREWFGDIKLVCMGGSRTRMRSMADDILDTLGLKISAGLELADISQTDRYAMYKAGPVLSVSHGIGGPSISILLHELTKLLHYAGISVDNMTFVRMGTSGGLGVKPGTVVVTNKVVNGELKAEYNLPVLGKVQTRPTLVDVSLAEQIIEASPEHLDVIQGMTMSCDCFYEGEARSDGAICEYTEEQKQQFFQDAYDAGIRNIEMEGQVFAAFITKLGIRGTLVCSTLLDRLEGDQLSTCHEDIQRYSMASREVVLSYISKHYSA